MFANDDCQIRSRVASERCVITTIDQQTAIRHPSAEPLKTIMGLNLSPKNKPAFGQYCTLEKSKSGKIAVGDMLKARFCRKK